MNLSPFGLSVAIVCSVSLLSGCATGPRFSPAPVPAKSSSKALVYFYRPAKVLGCGVAFSLEVNGELVGSLVNGGYLVINVSANRDTKLTLFDPIGRNPVQFVVGSTLTAPPVGLVAAVASAFYKDQDAGIYRFQSGESYFFRYDTVSFSGPRITLVSPEEGAREIQKCNLLKKAKGSIYN